MGERGAMIPPLTERRIPPSNVWSRPRPTLQGVRTLMWLDRLRHHLRYGIRGLRREPVFALTTLLTLALGTAATTTVFSVVDAELWKPLAFPHPEQLVAV